MANQPNDQPDGPPSQSGHSDSQNGQNMAHPRPEKLGVNLSTIRYLDGSVTSLHLKLDSLMEMMRTQMGQNQQLPAQVAQLAAQSPRRDLPLPAEEDDDFETIEHRQLPRRQLPRRERPFRDMTSRREIKPENGRQPSFAPFAPAGRQQLASPNQSNNPACNDPYNRETRSTFETKPRTYIKRSEVSQFSPTYPDPDDLGMVSGGKRLVIAEVMAFMERLDGDISDGNPEAENQVFSFLDTLLSDPALNRWNSELAAQDRRRLWYPGGLQAILNVLRQRFRQELAIASFKFKQDRLWLGDLTDNTGDDPDLNQLTAFIQKKLRYARQMGILDGHTWRGVMIQIRSQMDLQIRKYLPAPRNRGLTGRIYGYG
ncbi:hypothetical protein CONLIGDRAFT_687768 [Coniochaeta ligniaria NRRL 30616]|uniref:Uncharacterized protein n=1 Tax=Coniochaeta ligniaria NRRL 30616 TaxID=1408157 RepID=A0A1J7J3V9_9PEZI|nr:hypothetical protein CONLIGDRAFT_687768 [Coniochaeta ligniaria NRRL 30616]